MTDRVTGKRDETSTLAESSEDTNLCSSSTDTLLRIANFPFSELTSFKTETNTSRRDTSKKVKRTKMDTNEYLKEILERLNRLEVENSQLKARMHASTGPSRGNMDDTSQNFKTLPAFKDGFGSTISSEDSDFDAKILHLVACCKQLRSHYENLSILNKLLAVLPMNIQIQMKPEKVNDLDSYLSALEASYNSELLTLEAQNKLQAFKLNLNISFSDNLKTFLADVESFNYICSLSLKTKPRTWSNFKAITFFTENILRPGHLRAKFYDLWNEKMESTDIESWTHLIPRNLLMKAELSCKMLSATSTSDKIMVTSSQHLGPKNLPAVHYRTCFTCDESIKLFRSERMKDVHQCNRRVACSTCSRNHLNKHHEAAERMFNKSKCTAGSNQMNSGNSYL
eukprot:snap_masked-scaffold_103-processed-gene-0.1-mRNA-1 protein AED:1.00 eAED:1.00 QI:0/-1/0/0/-1/1/1/0/396